MPQTKIPETTFYSTNYLHTFPVIILKMTLHDAKLQLARYFII